ncbi:MAG: hypothetical protein ACK4MX_00465 [Thermaurantiacus sp.]
MGDWNGSDMGAAGEAALTGSGLRLAKARPLAPSGGEVVLWQGRPALGAGRLAELVALLGMLGLLSWLSIELVLPHFAGSQFAGQPDATALPLILAMLVGMMLIIALPIWLRSSARGRARYMLTNRRALVWLNDRIVGEALLFGANMQVTESELRFETPALWLDWRFRDEGPDALRFERIANPEEPATIAEAHGARWVGRPPEAADDAAEDREAA